jgi:hypothetical protein
LTASPLFFLFSSLATAQPDLAIVVMDHEDKQRRIHTQMMPAPTCEGLLRRFKSEGPFTLTLQAGEKPEDPTRGLVLNVSCIKPDGSVLTTDESIPPSLLRKQRAN